MKTCTGCKEEKNESEFQARKSSKDGLTARCKDCLSNYDRARASLPHRVEARKKYAQSNKGKIKGNAAKKAWQDRNLIKRSAHIIVGNAIRRGDLIKEPCEKCGEIIVDAHHDNHEYPLDMRWLCKKHHAKLHKDERKK